ncbi:MAG: sulfate adenylyltransferase small subunit [Acidobacteria bacterium 13_1_40CM_56_16]|nr:MAG: sulfate adenylyltransferase small subunit [Acidobacteria bacterium 13_1_40CM_56_16]
MTHNWTHLRELESESIYILRETVAQFRNPVLLYSVGKDSSVLVHVARKAFHPGPLPFPLLHVDTGYKFKEMLEFRERFTTEIGARLIVHRNDDAIAAGAHPLKLGVARCCGQLKTAALLHALDKNQFDAAIGGARREEERSRAKERVFSLRDTFGQWDPRRQRAELWSLYSGAIHEGETMRVFPLSNWTERDIWQYIVQEKIPVVPLYYAQERLVVRRNGTLIAADDSIHLKDGEVPERMWVRYRTLGCAPCTGAIESRATTLEEIAAETGAAKISERSTRIIDHGTNTMEDKKREGYF